VEFLLAAAGFGHLLVEDSPVDVATFLLWWNTVAATYLIVGAWYVRRHLDRDALDVQSARPTLMRGQRSSFLFTVAASLTGLSAALDVLQGFEARSCWRSASPCSPRADSEPRSHRGYLASAKKWPEWQQEANAM
jgi:hypothetical protein